VTMKTFGLYVSVRNISAFQFPFHAKIVNLQFCCGNNLWCQICNWHLALTHCLLFWGVS